MATTEAYLDNATTVPALPEGNLVDSTIRISFSPQSTTAEVDRFIQVFKELDRAQS